MSNENEFKVGDRVKLATTSEYYTFGDRGNPTNIEGTIYEIYDYYIGIRVRWDNCSRNSYNSEDLELIIVHSR